MKRTARALPILLLFGALASGAACEGEKKKKIEYQYAVTLTAELALDLRFPNDRTIATTCPATESWLVRLDETGDGTWEYSLLFNSDFSELYGCGGAGPCPDLALGLTIDSAPARAMLEGLTIAPADYVAATSGIDVTCRGIADTAVVPGDILTTDVFGASPTPTAGPEPTTVPGWKHTFTLRMLTVGNSNPLPYVAGAPAPEDLRFGAAASFSSTEFDIGIGATATNGLVVFAGGVSEEGTGAAALHDTVYFFDPRTLSFTQNATPLSDARTGLSATLIDNAGRPAVVFVGGASDPVAASQSTAIDVIYPDGALVSRALTTARAFHAAAYVPGKNAILIAGGEGYEPDADAFAGGALNTWEYFLAQGESTTGCLGGAAAGMHGEACATGGGNMSANRSRHTAVYFPGATTDRVLLGGGASGATAINAADLFRPENAGGAGDFGATGSLYDSAMFSGGARLTNSGVPELETPLLFGGLGTYATKESSQAGNYRDTVSGLIASFSPARPMLNQRGALQATALRDKTILLAGGADDGYVGLATESVERFVPTGDAGLGDFRGIDVVGTSCSAGVGCASLLVPRFGHTATRLEMTRTWLDGAVLIIGGGSAAGPPAELFVPAITCDPADHVTPVSPVTHVPAEPLSNATLPALCDRDRAGGQITDPSNPPS